MPAHRSRTDRWRESLQQIAERGGGIEFSVAKPKDDSRTGDISPDLVWRVRLLSVGDQELLFEQPVAMGHPVRFEVGMELVAVISVGQNRWMFRTHVLGPCGTAQPGPRGLRVAAPESVQRCARRDFMRVSTAELHLPQVECYPILDPGSVTAAEIANEAQIQDLDRGGQASNQGKDSILLPEVGPPFSALLKNIGGGGVGLMVKREEAAAAERARLVWMRVNLMPYIPAPMALTARIVHTHLDSAQNLYAGVAFDFAFNPAHREFVLDQVTKYVNKVQANAKAAA